MEDAAMATVQGAGLACPAGSAQAAGRFSKAAAATTVTSAAQP